MKLSFAVLNGPNLNLLGTREPETYGHETLADLEKALVGEAKKHNVDVTFFQSNIEGELVDEIQAKGQTSQGIILNPAAYTHTSVAIRDAIAAVSVPVIEVHITNVFARESFRHQSYISPVAQAVLSGFGRHGYLMALQYLVATHAPKDGN